MRLLLLLGTLAACAWCGDGPVAAPTVLLTAFQPFAERAANGSRTVAEHLRTGMSEVRIEVLVLPVAWGEPERQLPAAVQRLRPRLLIGLGEGWPQAVMVERIARNRAAGDDERRMPGAGVLLAGGPAERRGTLQFDPAWRIGDGIAVQASDDAGSYLCNALYYTALGDLGTAVGRVGFVHLPPQGAVPDREYAARFAPVVRELIRRNL